MMNNQQNGALKTQSQGNLPVFAQPAFIPPLTQEEEELNLRPTFRHISVDTGPPLAAIGRPLDKFVLL